MEHENETALAAAPKVGDVVSVPAVVRAVHDGAATVQLAGEDDTTEAMRFTGPTGAISSELVAPR